MNFHTEVFLPLTRGYLSEFTYEIDSVAFESAVRISMKFIRATLR